MALSYGVYFGIYDRDIATCLRRRLGMTSVIDGMKPLLASPFHTQLVIARFDLVLGKPNGVTFYSRVNIKLLHLTWQGFIDLRLKNAPETRDREQGL